MHVLTHRINVAPKKRIFLQQKKSHSSSSSTPVVLDGPSHCRHSLPLLRVPRVVVDGERPRQPQDARACAGVAQVGHRQRPSAEHQHGGRRTGQLGGGAVRAELLVNLGVQRERK